MKIHSQATKGHLIVGIALILLSLGSLIANLFLDTKILPFLIFFFGVWGGIETGRYLEAWMRKRHVKISPHHRRGHSRPDCRRSVAFGQDYLPGR